MPATSIQPPSSTWFISRYLWLGWFVILALVTIILDYSTYDSRNKVHDGGVICPLLILAAVSIFFWVPWLRARLRTGGFMRLAESHGLGFKGSLPKTDLALYPTFYLFQSTQFHEAKNYVAGQFDGGEVVIMDYGYLTTRMRGQYLDTSVHRQTVLILPLAGQGLPHFSLIARRSRLEQMRHDSPLDNVPELPVARDNQTFHELYKLAGDDFDRIERVFTPQKIALLADHEGWNIEVRSGTPLIYLMEHRVAPRDIPGWAVQARQLVQNLKSN